MLTKCWRNYMNKRHVIFCRSMHWQQRGKRLQQSLWFREEGESEQMQWILKSTTAQS